MCDQPHAGLTKTPPLRPAGKAATRKDRVVPEQDNPMQQIITRCWEDEAFKVRLVADPAATLAAEGVEIPEGVTVRVVVESATERALVVPLPPDRELADAELAGIHGGWFFSCIMPDCNTGTSPA